MDYNFIYLYIYLHFQWSILITLYMTIKSTFILQYIASQFWFCNTGYMIAEQVFNQIIISSKRYIQIVSVVYFVTFEKWSPYTRPSTTQLCLYHFLLTHFML